MDRVIDENRAHFKLYRKLTSNTRGNNKMKSLILCLTIALIAIIPCNSILICGEDNILAIEKLKDDAAEVKKFYEEALETVNNFTTSYASNSAFRIDALTKYHYALTNLRILQSALETYFLHNPTEDDLDANITITTYYFMVLDSTFWNQLANLPASAWTDTNTKQYYESLRGTLNSDIKQISEVIDQLGQVQAIEKRQLDTTLTTFATNPPFFRPNGPTGGGGMFFPDLGDLNFGSILLLIPTLAYIMFNIFFAPFFPPFFKPTNQ